MTGLVPLLLAASITGPAPPEMREFALYKWQQRIGREESFIARDSHGTDIRTAFAFTDRSRPVPLSSSLRLAPDGTPQRFEVWGSTSRMSNIDVRVVVSEKTITIPQHGATRTVPRPARFFVGSAYAPVCVTEQLLRYWSTHGSPRSLTVFPVGEVTIERRGEDVVNDDEGKPRTLVRYSIGGLQ